MGGILKSHTSESGYFKDYGADLRENYLTNQLLIPVNKIIKVKAECRDTISEAFESRKVLFTEKFKRVLLCTTASHMPRALFIFRTIFPSEVQIEPIPNPKEDSLNPDQESELLKITKDLFTSIGPIDHNMTWEKWYAAHEEFYKAQRAIHTRFKESGNGSQHAYSSIY